ncbi:MAG: copper amine oxidase N-terminal domain-containing protein [Dehalobacter sp.]|nr:copper amine oxidase N-terminal domain-containing protein [Dehalobacter sp.]
MGRKYLVILLLTLFFVLSLKMSAQASPQVILDGKTLIFDVPPTIEDGRTLVPLRAIFEALGAIVKWDETTKTVTATKDDTETKLVIGGQVSKNGVPVNLDVPAKIIDGRTMVPLRFVSEAFGCQVEWNNDTQIININKISPLHINVSSALYDSKEGQFSIKYPLGWTIKEQNQGNTGSGVLMTPVDKKLAGILAFSIPIDKQYTIDDALVLYTSSFSEDFIEISRSKVNINTGEAWLILNNQNEKVSSNAYVIVSVDNYRYYQVIAWGETPDWPAIENSYREIVCSISPAKNESKIPPSNISSELSKEFGSIGGLSSYKISDFTISDTIFVSFEMNDYDADKRWHELPESTRRSFLQSVLNRLRGWFPNKDISVTVKLTFDYHTWNPDLDDHIVSFDVKRGWYVSNTYYSGSAYYFKSLNTTSINPDK